MIADAERRIRASGRPDFSIEQIPLDDAKTYELLCRGDTEGVFQIESAGMTDLVIEAASRARFKEMIPLVALYRPGPARLGHGRRLRQPQARRSRRSSTCCPSSRSCTAETLGVIVYQDQVLQIANRLAGYSLGEADLLRRAMGKKKPEEMAKQRERFVAGCVAARHRREEGRGGLRADGGVRGLRLRRSRTRPPTR